MKGNAYQNSKSSLSVLSINIFFPSPRSIGAKRFEELIGHLLVSAGNETTSLAGGAFVAAINRLCSASKSSIAFFIKAKSTVRETSNPETGTPTTEMHSPSLITE